ncbi:MAG: hypothetical protein DHS20C13_11200 [Thermodesulfobacteriota bacterium]|nr:MAG: hypothetical protein DHS20C13_11200 [Thermodesulfobacteriota bacterium]
MAIPKILHQTYKTHEIPAQLEEYRRKLIELHPNWEYRFYGDEECRDIVEQHFPSFLPVYDSYSAPAQKADIFRIIVVYALGGFYLDIDIECIKSLDPLCEFRCVFAEELTITQEQATELGHRDLLRVANYMFGSEPGHPFLLHILKRIAQESERDITSENDVLESTGPGLVTTVYHDSLEDFTDLVLLRNIDFICPITAVVGCRFGNYAEHHHVGTWRWENSLTQPLVDPVQRKMVTESQRNKIYSEIDSEIKKIPLEETIYQLKTYNDKPDDGLSYVYDLTSRIGVSLKDTKHLKGQKVLISGMPHLYTDKISPSNLNVVSTTFESDGLLPFWVETINKHYQYCVVPHPHVKKMFKHSGVNVPIEVINLGFTRYNRLYKQALPEGLFRVGFLGVPTARKNLFKLFQACVNLSSEIPGLRLVVHVARPFSDMLKPELTLVKLSPFVEWTEGPISEDEVAQWYSKLSCYVFPSSTEGWSFTPRESLYMGIPTVLTDIPVHKELVESGYCKVIPLNGKEKASFDGIISGTWDRVSVEDIENAIRDLYQNYGNYYSKALQGSQWIENKWTNESSQQNLLNFLLKI